MQRFQQRRNAYAVCNDIVQFGDSHTLLLHRIAVAQRYAVIFQRLVVYGYTIRSTDSVLTAVALADAVFLVVLAMEVELQVVDNLTSLFGQTVLLIVRSSWRTAKPAWC